MCRLTSRLQLFGFVFVAAACITAAPAKKDDPTGPVTAEQLKATEKNLKDIALAMHDHNDSDISEALPVNYGAKEGKPRLSWRVAILPYLGEKKLFGEFKLDEPWDSDNNKKLIERMPKVFAPVRGKAEKGETYYQMFAGDRTLLDDTGMGLSVGGISVMDGTANTFMVAEGAKPVIWTKPDDIPFDGKTAPKLGGMFNGDFHVVMADGSVKFVPKGTDPTVIRYAIDRADGQVIDIDAAIEKAKEKK
jgi:hypothetical protein